MSNNALQLKTSDVTDAGGGWTAESSNTATLSTSGMSYRFETFSNYSRLVRFTLTGLLIITASGSGVVNYSLVVPPGLLPSWAQPGIGYIGGGTSVSIPGMPSSPLNVGIYGSSAGSGNSLTLNIANSFTGTILTPTTPINWVFTYLAK